MTSCSTVQSSLWNIVNAAKNKLNVTADIGTIRANWLMGGIIVIPDVT